MVFLGFLRLVRHTANYSLNVYWTRGQVGVRSKTEKKQVWTTTTTANAPSFADKVKLGSEVVPLIKI